MTENFDDIPVINNKINHRFEIRLGEDLGIVPYNIKDDLIALFHTEVPGKYGGHGIGTRLALYALNYAKENNLKILPYCPFIAGYIKKHPEWLPYVKDFPPTEKR